VRQLDLFSPDQETLRHGHRLIERLELPEAIELFKGLFGLYSSGWVSCALGVYGRFQVKADWSFSVLAEW